jgi:hypothetical protein
VLFSPCLHFEFFPFHNDSPTILVLSRALRQRRRVKSCG